MLAFIVQIVVALVLSAAATLIQQALAKRPEEQRKPGVRGELQVGGDNPLACILGRYATAGQLEYAGTWGNPGGVPNAKFVKVVSVSDLPVRGLSGFYVDGARVTFAATPDPEFGYPVLEYRRGSRDFLWVKFYDGSQSAADPYLLDKFGADPERPWLPDMVGRGVAYFIATAHVNREFFPQFPEYLAEIDGIPLDDPRSGAPVHDNPAVAIRTLLLGLSYVGAWFYGPQGIGEHHLRDFEAQMDKCDAAVELDGGGSEKRFRFGYELTVDEEPHAVIAELLEACSGRIAEIGGAYRLLAGEPGEPVASFSDDDIVISEGQTYDPFPGLEETHNAITATYPEPAEAWGMKDAPPRYSSVLEANDDGRRLPFAAEFRAVPHALQVQRLMRAMIEESRRFRRHSFTAPPDWWQYEPLDVVAWQSARNGYDGKRFLLTVMEDLPTANQVAGLQETDPADYQWSSEFELPFDLTPVVIQRPDAQPMSGWQALPYVFVDAASKARRPGIEVRFAGEIDDVRAVRVQVRLAATAAIVFDGDSPYDALAEAPSIILHGSFLPATAYEARGLFLPHSGRQTEWSAWLAVTTPDTRMSEAELEDAINARLDQVSDQIPSYLEQLRTDLDELAAALNSQVATEQQQRGQVLIALGARHEQSQASIIQLAATSASADEALGTLITGLDTRLTTAEGTVSGQTTTLFGLDSRVTTAEGAIIAQGSAITAIEAEIDLLNTSGDAVASALQALQSFVIYQGNQLLAQSEALTLVAAAAGEATAEGLFRIVAVATPEDALSAVELQVKSAVGGAWAAGSIQVLAYANADGTIYSRIRLNANSTQIGLPGVDGGDFIPVFEVAEVDGVRSIVIPPSVIQDNSIDRKKIDIGSVTTIGYRKNPTGQTRTRTQWQNGGAGNVIDAIQIAPVGDGIVIGRFEVTLLDSGSHVGTDWIRIIDKDNNILEQVDIATPGNTYNNHRVIVTVIAEDLPPGSNELTALLFTAVSGSANLAATGVQWLIEEHHRAGIQAGGADAASATYRATIMGTPNSANPSGSAIPLGTSDQKRRVLIATQYKSANNVSNAVINGITAKKIASWVHPDTNFKMQLWRATVPLDTAATINFTSTGTLETFQAVVYTAITASETEIGLKYGSGTSSPFSRNNFEIQDGGVAIVFAFGTNADAFALAFTGVDTPTENVEADNGSLHYAAYSFLTTESTNDDDLTLSWTATGVDKVLMLGVSYR